MKTITAGFFRSKISGNSFVPLLAAVGLLLLATGAKAQPLPGGKFGPTNTPLMAWSFHDHTNWTDNDGYAPLSFTNLNYSYLGDGDSLVVDTNIPAWLQFHVVENDGTTNLTVDNGTVMFWFAPDWNSTGDTNGGFGPGEYGRLLEAGVYTPDSSFGWWSILVDAGGTNIYFAAQTNDLSSNLTVYVTAPIDWTTNYFHFVAVTYSPSNTALYLDGDLVTNGPPMTVYPGPDVLTNGFYIGSDSNGVLQAHGLFNTVATYNYPLNSNDVQTIFNYEYGYYVISPWNIPFMDNLKSAPSNPSYAPQFNVITGQGTLQWDGAASTCSYGTNAFNIWITNVIVTASGSGSNNMSLTFTIGGGADNVPYDVFANSVLGFGTNSMAWAWMGQGYHCNTYTLTNLPNTTCFLILGTPQDTSGFGLTDAYEALVMQVNPAGSQTDSYGVPYAWYAEQGLNPYTAGMGGQDPDLDGLLNYQEYFYGTNPQVSEGFAIWTSAAN